jgi:hypothetical protein
LGRCAVRAGLVSSRSHRTAADSAPLMIGWIYRTMEAAIGLHTCGLHFAATQSYSLSTS